MAIETTGRLGSVAVLSGQDVLRQANLDPNSRSAATLTPQIDDMLRWCRETDQFPHFISVADGPGSFTGLRIAVTAAKTLSYALRLPLVAVDSLAAIAAAAMDQHDDVRSLCVVLNAYRNQVFAGTFDRQQLLPPIDAIPNSYTATPDLVQVIDLSGWGQWWASVNPDTPITGDVIPDIESSRDRISRDCDAVGVGLIAIRAAQANAFTDPLSLVPRYLKVSAAEEKAAKRAAEQA